MDMSVKKCFFKSVLSQFNDISLTFLMHLSNSTLQLYTVGCKNIKKRKNVKFLNLVYLYLDNYQRNKYKNFISAII